MTEDEAKERLRSRGYVEGEGGWWFLGVVLARVVEESQGYCVATYRPDMVESEHYPA